MSSQGYQVERKRSFGIGGAGNIRAPAEAVITQTVSNSSNGSERRGSAWSINSQNASSIVDKILRRPSKAEVIVEGEQK